MCAQLHRRFSLCCDNTHLLILDSSTPDKFSKHIIFHLPNAVFRSNSHAGKFCWPKSIPISTCNLSTIPLAHPNIDFITLATTGSFVFSICDDLRHLKECRDYGSRLLEQAYRHLFVDTPLKCKHPLCHGPPCMCEEGRRGQVWREGRLRYTPMSTGEQLLSLFLKNDAGKDILICDECVCCPSCLRGVSVDNLFIVCSCVYQE